MTSSALQAYAQDTIARLWDYQKAAFRGEDHLFESVISNPTRPPVFLAQHADRNVIVNMDAPPSQRGAVLAAVKIEDRHRWFRSMRSSQALTQTVFGNLRELGKLGLLSEVQAEDGGAAFVEGEPSAADLEYPVVHLGEPRSTSVDLLLRATSRVAVECKFAEIEIGTCSRPRLPRDHRSYCNGSYTVQNGRPDRCSLSSEGILYWKYVPDLFHWPADTDRARCPLNSTYQLVRNVLAACIDSRGAVDRQAHALLVYDARNPAFVTGGEALKAYGSVKAALKVPSLLRRCSWQRVLRRLAQDRDLAWLTAALDAKYGLRAEDAR